MNITFKNIEYFSFAAILLTAIYPNSIFADTTFLGLKMDQIQKLIILFLILPSVLLCGIRYNLLSPVIGYLVILIITLLLSDVDPAFSLKTFIGMSIGWIFLSIRWRYLLTRDILIVLALIPVITVIIGIFLDILNIYPLFRSDYGLSRLQGASIPAALAMQAFFGVFACLMMYQIDGGYRKKKYLLILIVNMAILVFSGGRMGTIVAVLAIILSFRSHVYRLLYNIKSFFYFIFALPLVASGFFLILSYLEKRSYLDEGGEINTSGRFYAWRFFLNMAADNFWLGSGLGSSLLLKKDIAIEAFVVPHNEYIHYYYDAGIVGLSIIIISFILLYRSLKRRIVKGDVINLNTLFFVLVIYSITDNSLSTIHFTLPFSLTIVALLQQKNAGI